ncbi:glucose dehydrogenase [FAD, quinone]-like [Sitodiplosis mosellana]|uniref:glucose dehydrogenase [FAD, quinone]-like n=1 Tax=Sitodiplosis mosellana TaxID=263140 RepID=UPI002443A201|nr:glucose dehydrogenase [FAD, quinone]-like [Sitodiplosis mosellana]
MLGGSSSINALLYVRGNRRDYNVHWQTAGGADWSWDSVLPYFQKFESNLSPNEASLNIENYPTTDFDENIKSMLQQFYESLGFKHLDDLYDDSFIGFARAKGILTKGTRSSSAKAFLRSELIGKRNNLHVIKMAHVSRIIVNKANKQVSGVEFTRLPEQKTIVANVRKEVIVSAGAVNTPQLLMLSGIGPTDQLTPHQIEIIQSLPGVGRNLQDHIMLPYIFSLHKSTAQSPTYQFLADNFMSYLLNRSGMFSNLGSVDYMGFFSTLNDTLYPDIQVMHYLISKQSTDSMKFLLSLFNYKQHIIDAVVAANLEADTLLVLMILLNPKSHGSITLRSKKPFDSPKIHTNYLKEIDDVKTLVRAMKIIDKLTETKIFKEHEGEIVNFELKECDRFPRNADTFWECYVRHLSITVYHPVGTCKMGSPSDDEGSVVDGQLNVHGVNGLRVADASIMPKIVSGNTNAATVMIGEKVAEFIKQKWEKHQIKEEL